MRVGHRRVAACWLARPTVHGMTGPLVRQLRSVEIEDAAVVLGRAFQDDPLMAYAIPDDDLRAMILPGSGRPGVWLANHLGQVWCTDDLAAVACWRTPGQQRTSAAQLHEAGASQLPQSLRDGVGSRTEPVYEYLESRRDAHDIPAAHWYLTMIGVEPGRRRQGLGSAVMSPVLSTATEQHVPVYLETFGPQNVAFYSGQGFELIETAPEPSSGLTYWLFLRA